MKSMLSVVLLSFMMTLPVLAGMEEGREIFKTRCGTCHQLPDPDMLDPEQWKKVLDSMQNLMEKSGWGKLSGEEYENLLEYLNSSAAGVKDGKKDGKKDVQ